MATASRKWSRIPGKEETLTGKVTKVAQAVLEGSSHYYLMVEGSDAIFDVPVAEFIDVIRVEPGMEITLEYKEGKKTNTVTALELPRQKRGYSMELSLLLGEQIVVIFLMMAIGYVIVKTGFFQVEDSKVLSNLVIYICFPCVMIDSFQIELTQRTAAGLAIAVVAAAAAHLFMIVVVWLLGKPLGFNRIEKVSIIYTNAGISGDPAGQRGAGRRMGFLYHGFPAGTEHPDLDPLRQRAERPE